MLSQKRCLFCVFQLVFKKSAKDIDDHVVSDTHKNDNDQSW